MKKIIFLLTLSAFSLKAETADSVRSLVIKNSQVKPQATVIRSTPYKFKDPTKAFLLSLGHSALPILAGYYLTDHDKYSAIGSGCLIYGMLVGPSAGSFYAEDVQSGVIGLGLRLGGTALFMKGVSEAFDGGFLDDDDGNDGGAAMTGGLILYSVGALYSFIAAPLSAHEYNVKHRLTIVPSYNLHSRLLAVNAQFTF